MKLQNKFLLAFVVLCTPVQNSLAAVKTAEQSFVIQKFAVSIALVIVFAVILYAVLYFYKKLFMNKENKHANTSKSLENSLKSPDDFNESIAIFLEKTKPNQ